MIIGVPKEIKTQENRVSLTPAGVEDLKAAGHRVLVETMAGAGSGFTDEEYQASGAETVGTAAEVFAGADMILKVKEPLEPEYRLFREGQILFTYLHLAPDPKQAKALMDAGVTAFAYETVQVGHQLPLLAPMS